MRTYSKDGSEQFNTYLDSVLSTLSQEIEQAVGSPFVALILAGGYGRGEGACVIKDGKESPYNDFDLFLVVREPYVVAEKVLEVTRSYEKLLNIEVDIGRPLTLNAIRKLPHQLMWQDLLQSHIVLRGPQDILTSQAPSFLSDPLPQVEALRLLLNRGSGLVQAIAHRYDMMRDPSCTPPDEDFVRRNREKCTLALGDSLLITHGMYAPPLDTRLERLTGAVRTYGIDNPELILSLYTQAAAFKTRPDSIPTEQPSLDTLRETASLWVQTMLHCESVRTGRAWESGRAYAGDPFRREPEQHTPIRLARNLVKNLNRGVVSFSYPREGLYGQLAVLLDSLEPGSRTWRDLYRQFYDQWTQYN
ncbi:MAG: hypothetical protein JXK93_09745 [Sphaerochaetaceae bacterium]|nr:hypothetical protein [Sphaerochaetaceae bacterium]